MEGEIDTIDAAVVHCRGRPSQVSGIRGEEGDKKRRSFCSLGISCLGPPPPPGVAGDGSIFSIICFESKQQSSVLHPPFAVRPENGQSLEHIPKSVTFKNSVVDLSSEVEAFM